MNPMLGEQAPDTYLTAGEVVERRDKLATACPVRVAQYHAADYRNPGQLPDGAVLVVDSAQSGCQIAENLLAGGRRVILATSPVGRAPPVTAAGTR
jgi:putative flavoprotein involved in K+ transport